MKCFLISFTLLTFVLHLHAQPEVLWTRAFGGAQGEQGLAIIQAANGNIVPVGNEESFDGGGADGWILELNEEDGEEIWSANFGGAGYDRFYDVIQVDDQFVTSGYGGSFGNVQFQFWLTRINENHNQVWSRDFGGGEHERCNDLIQTAAGGFAFTGNTYSVGAGEGDGWIVVTNENGEQIWAEAFGGEGEDGFSGITHGDDDNIIVAGKTNSFGAGGYDFWLLKLNAEGEEVWSETYGGEEDDQCHSIIRTDDNCYVMAGTTVSFGENAGDFWMIKVNEDGEEIWSRTFDSDCDELCRTVIQTVDGGFMLAGHNWAYNDARCDGWLIRTDDEGEELWSETYGGDQADVFVDIVQMDDGGYAITGWTSSIGAGGLDLWVVRLGPEPAGVLQGYVLDLVEDEPLEGAAIVTTNGLNTETNEEGFFRIEPAWVGDFDITASLRGYNDLTLEDQNIGEEDELEVVFRLTHPEFEPSRERFEAELEPDETTEFEFTIRNDGNGPLRYSVERRLIGDANADPWELRDLYNLEEILEDNQINGVVFVNGRYYISGGNGRQPVNKIYILDENGEYVDEFDQVQESDYGMRDLAWDGELIWGADENDDEVECLFGYNIDGEHIATIEGEAASYRSLTWDSDRQCFWSADITSDIWATDVEGNLATTIERPGELRTYGLAYWSDDPDGYQLYTFSRGEEGAIDINKVNLNNGDAVFVATVDLGGNNRPGGIFITNRFDIYSWVLISIVQSPDQLAIWQIEGRREWFQVEPLAGIIEAENSENFILTLDATGLPVDNTFEGELAFIHNALAGETTLAVTLDCVEGIVQTSRELDLEIGWNTVSVNIQPDEDEDIEDLMVSLVEDDLLIMMKDGSGHFYRPDYNFNNIPGWYVEEGYQIKMRNAGMLILEGMSVLSETPIRLEAGWHIVSYYPRRSIEATVALSGIVDHLIIAKDGKGNFYIPEWEFSNMGDMCVGQGYYMNVEEEVVLVYQTGQERNAECRMQDSEHQTLNTGLNMSLLVLVEQPLEGEISVFASNKLVGSGILQNGICGLAIWGDDPTTEIIDGALEGQELELRLIDENELLPLTLETLSGSSIYQTDNYWVVKLGSAVEPPSEFGIVGVYPNPFNSTTTITYSLPVVGLVELKLFNLAGREIATLINESKQPGIHTNTLIAADLPSGLYFMKLNANGRVLTSKIMLLK
ncbi:MAG: T9SS type A sorting domain-containing protein [Candidatus Hatepunaea meridiana]|nr:T9SS type A sorting domain-containing protein [Candidatus Hatepunaea meridiana]